MGEAYITETEVARLAKTLLEKSERIREMRTVEQAMAEDLVTLAERCDKLEAELSVERHNLAISEHQRRELGLKLARLRAALSELLLAIEDDGPSGCSGVMSDGTRVWKGSFLRRIEDARAALNEKKSFDADSRALGC